MLISIANRCGGVRAQRGALNRESPSQSREHVQSVRSRAVVNQDGQDKSVLPCGTGQGETVTSDGLVFEVMSLDGRKIEKVKNSASVGLQELPNEQ